MSLAVAGATVDLEAVICAGNAGACTAFAAIAGLVAAAGTGLTVGAGLVAAGWEVGVIGVSAAAVAGLAAAGTGLAVMAVFIAGTGVGCGAAVSLATAAAGTADDGCPPAAFCPAAAGFAASAGLAAAAGGCTADTAFAAVMSFAAGDGAALLGEGAACCCGSGRGALGVALEALVVGAVGASKVALFSAAARFDSDESVAGGRGTLSLRCGGA